MKRKGRVGVQMEVGSGSREWKQGVEEWGVEGKIGGKREKSFFYNSLTLPGDQWHTHLRV